MAESIHDWAVKLGMVVDNASISAAAKLQDDFTASVVKSNERIKASNEERVRAEQQAQKMREGEKIRQANLSLEDSTEERKVKLGGLFIAGAINAQLFVKELQNINAEYRQMASVDTSAVAKFGAGIQAPSFEAEAARASELANLKADIIARSRIAAQQAADEQVAADNAALLSFQSNAMRRLQDEQQSAQQLREMRDYYRAQEVEAARTAADQIAAEEQRIADNQRLVNAGDRQRARRDANDRWKESVDAAARISVAEETAAAKRAATDKQDAVRVAQFNQEQRRAANDRWKESVDAAGKIATLNRHAAAEQKTLDDDQAARTAKYNRDQRRAANDTWKYQQDQIGARAANARAAAAEAAQVARVNNLLQQYGNHAENVAADIAFLNAAHQRGAISTQQHGVAIAEATRRMNSMRGGAGNMGYAIGELARGAEDFITVMSITGFKMESVGMAMRGAGNNISQATNLIAGPLMGAAVGVAAILGGQLVSALMRSEEETSNWNKALKETTERLEAIAKFQTSDLELKFRVQDIAKEDLFEGVRLATAGIRDIEILKSKINEGEESMRAFNAEMLKLALGNGAAQELENAFNDIGDTLVNGRHLEAKFREQFKKISEDMAGQINKGIAPETAFTTFKERMRLLNNEMTRELKAPFDLPGQENTTVLPNDPQDVQAQIDSLEKVAKLDEEGKSRLKVLIQLKKDLAAEETIMEERRTRLSAAAIEHNNNLKRNTDLQLNRIKAVSQAEVDAADDAIKREELLLKYKDLSAANAAKWADRELSYMKQIRDAERQVASQKAQETENANTLNSLKKDLMDVDELALLERMTAEERKAYEWAKKRAEIMITGAASPGELENIFAQQANFRMAEIDLEFKKSAPAYQTAGSNLAQTTASMNSEILRGMGQTKDKDMISELKAIKEALTGARGVKLVEVD
jgi:hypothetical protein